MVTLPTSLFLVVYVASMTSAARLLRGALRGVAVLACAASVAVLAFSGPAVVLAVAVFAVALITPLHAGEQDGSASGAAPIYGSGHQASSPSSSWKVPVGPSLPIVAIRTMFRALISTGRP